MIGSLRMAHICCNPAQDSMNLHLHVSCGPVKNNACRWRDAMPNIGMYRCDIIRPWVCNPDSLQCAPLRVKIAGLLIGRREQITFVPSHLEFCFRSCEFLLHAEVVPCISRLKSACIPCDAMGLLPVIHMYSRSPWPFRGSWYCRAEHH